MKALWLRKIGTVQLSDTQSNIEKVLDQLFLYEY